MYQQNHHYMYSILYKQYTLYMHTLSVCLIRTFKKELLATSAAEDFQDQYQTVGPPAVATVDAPRCMPHIPRIKTMEQRETNPYDKHSII